MCTVTVNTVINNTFMNYFEHFATNVRPHQFSWCSLKPNPEKTLDMLATP